MLKPHLLYGPEAKWDRHVEQLTAVDSRGCKHKQETCAPDPQARLVVARLLCGILSLYKMSSSQVRCVIPTGPGALRPSSRAPGKHVFWPSANNPNNLINSTLHEFVICKLLLFFTKANKWSSPRTFSSTNFVTWAGGIESNNTIRAWFVFFSKEDREQWNLFISWVLQNLNQLIRDKVEHLPGFVIIKRQTMSLASMRKSDA